jgi:hypothetical protein
MFGLAPALAHKPAAGKRIGKRFLTLRARL